jgi:glycogen synthase
MKLLFLSNFYPPYELGGMEQLTSEVSAGLQARGHQVTVLTSRAGLAKDKAQGGKTIRSLYLEADIHYYRITDFFLARRRQESANSHELRRAIDRVQPDVLVVWNMWNLSRNLPYWAEQWMPNRVAYYIASTWPMDLTMHEEYWNLPASHKLSEIAKRSLRTVAFADLRRECYPKKLAFGQTRCVSRYMRDKLVAANAIPSTAEVLYNGIDPAAFLHTPSSNVSSEEAPLRLLYFGSLLPIKGVHVAIDALGALAGQGLAERVELTILGRGHPDYVASLVEQVKKLNLQSRVHFREWIDRADIPAMLHRHDVFLFTSTGPEAMARTVMEAMAAGLVVIGSEVGGQVEMLVHEENALTFASGDADRLADHIRYLLDEPARRLELAKAGRETILDRFTLDKMVMNVEAWLEAVIP